MMAQEVKQITNTDHHILRFTIKQRNLIMPVLCVNECQQRNVCEVEAFKIKLLGTLNGTQLET